MLKQTPYLLLAALALAACQPDSGSTSANPTPAAGAAASDTAASEAPAAASDAAVSTVGHGTQTTVVEHGSGKTASAPANQEDPAFKADAALLLKTIEEIGTESSTFLDSEEMQEKVREVAKTTDKARKDSLSVEIYRSNITIYQNAVKKLEALAVKDREVIEQRDLWIRKFKTDIALFEAQIKEQGNNLSDAEIEKKYQNLYRENRELAQDAVEQNMMFNKRLR